MSPECSQPSIDGLGRLLGLARSSPGTRCRRGTAPRRRRRSTPRSRGSPARRSRVVAALRAPRHRPARLAHPVDLAERHTDRVEPLEDRPRDRRRAGDAATTASRPIKLADVGERHGVEERPRLALLLGDGAVALGRLDRRLRPRRPRRTCALFAGFGGQRGVDAVVDLLPDPRHAEHDLGVHLLRGTTASWSGPGSSTRCSRGSAPGSGSSSARRCAPSAGS